MKHVFYKLGLLIFPFLFFMTFSCETDQNTNQLQESTPIEINYEGDGGEFGGEDEEDGGEEEEPREEGNLQTDRGPWKAIEVLDSLGVYQPLINGEMIEFVQNSTVITGLEVIDPCMATASHNDNHVFNLGLIDLPNCGTILDFRVVDLYLQIDFQCPGYICTRKYYKFDEPEAYE